MVVIVWVMKIHVNPLLQMPGNDASYFMVMSILFIKDKMTKNKNKKLMSALKTQS